MIPAGIYGKLTDQYAPTDNMITSGRLKAGQEAWDPVTGKSYRFVVATAAIAVNKVCKFDSGQADANGMIPTTAKTDYPEGVNDTGSAITSTYYFWMLTGGPCTPLVAAATAAGANLRPSVTSGQLEAADNAQVENILFRSLAASGAGGATACRMS